MKKEIEKAFKKLKKAFPDDYVVLSLEYKKYSSVCDNEEAITYKAYSGKRGRDWSADHKTPIEAVDEIIKIKGD